MVRTTKSWKGAPILLRFLFVCFCLLMYSGISVKLKEAFTICLVYLDYSTGSRWILCFSWWLRQLLFILFGQVSFLVGDEFKWYLSAMAHEKWKKTNKQRLISIGSNIWTITIQWLAEVHRFESCWFNSTITSFSHSFYFNISSYIKMMLLSLIYVS